MHHSQIILYKNETRGRSIKGKVKTNERLTASVMHCVWSWTVSRPNISPQSMHDNCITQKQIQQNKKWALQIETHCEGEFMKSGIEW